jgi:hypothetical protein
LSLVGVSRRTLIVAGTSALLGAGAGSGATALLSSSRTGPTLWQRGDRSGAPRVGGPDRATGQRIPHHVEEPAEWSAFCDPINPYGFVAFDVDPGQLGGTTSMAATYYSVHGPYGETTAVDQFTLTRPRRDSAASGTS